MPETQDIWRYIESLIIDFGIDRHLVYKDLSRAEIGSSSAIVFLKIANNLNISILNIFEKSIDIEQLRCQLACHNETPRIPEAYLLGAYSSTTSLRSVLTEFNRFGRYDDVMKYLQLSSKTLEEHHRISITTVHKALTYMGHFLKENELKNIAYRNADAFLKMDFFGEPFSKCLENHKPAQAFFENVHLIEKNWTYNIIKEDMNSVIVDTNQTTEMMDINSSANYTDDLTVNIRFGFIERIINRMGLSCRIEQLKPVASRGHFQFKVEMLGGFSS